MSTVVITPPAVPVVSLDDAKAQCRVDHSDDDAYITSLIGVATQHIAAPDGWLGRSLVNQVLEHRVDGFLWCSPPDLPLPGRPIVSITSIKYDDTDGVEQTLDPSVYRLIGSTSNPRLALAYGKSWPSTRRQAEAVRIRYTAGYGATAASVPLPIVHAVKLLIEHYYENRSAVTTDGNAPAVMPLGVDALLAPYAPDRIF